MPSIRCQSLCVTQFAVQCWSFIQVESKQIRCSIMSTRPDDACIFGCQDLHCATTHQVRHISKLMIWQPVYIVADSAICFVWGTEFFLGCSTGQVLFIFLQHCALAIWNVLKCFRSFEIFPKAFGLKWLACWNWVNWRCGRICCNAQETDICCYKCDQSNISLTRVSLHMH
jgi:hypothetical protein